MTGNEPIPGPMARKRGMVKPILMAGMAAVALWRLPPLIEKLGNSGMLGSDGIKESAMSEIDRALGQAGANTSIPVFSRDGTQDELIIFTPDDAKLTAEQRRKMLEEAQLKRSMSARPSPTVRVVGPDEDSGG